MNLLVYCAGGFGMEVLDIARRIDAGGKRWDEVAFIDDGQRGEKVYGASVYRLEAALQRFGAAGMEVAIANGEPFVRMALRQKVEAAGVRLAKLVDPSASVSATATLGDGTIVFPGCFVSSEAKLAANCAVIAGALVGHHSLIGDDCIVAGQVNVGGGCKIGNRTYLGMGSQIREGRSVGAATIVGMGSIVFSDIPDEVIALGNPCRPMRPNIEKRVFA
jgi:sugar O-acyltransferase (sialic acid O-acetyltransferase NeuD family)